MKKMVVLGMGLCLALAFTSCKSSESAYKKAYEKAKQQELAEAPAVEEAPAPVVAAPVEAPAAPVAVGTIREEKVELVSGDGLKAYSVVCGSFGVKANADGLKAKLDGEGYNAKVVYNAERNMYRVVVSSFDDRVQAAQARDDFKAKHSGNADFQKSWLLYNVK
ncbi:MAG: SPOR domain-containing protein [Bacteroides sp.]|nr:SPOR domain-containing protein [Bacteroidaceae bacterium]MBQ7351062.1 SPOR domain-containing protein [Bacteroides sp.]